MDLPLVDLVAEAVQREDRQRASHRRLIATFGIAPCPRRFDRLLAWVGTGLERTGARLRHRVDCGCPEQGTPAPVS